MAKKKTDNKSPEVVLDGVSYKLRRLAASDTEAFSDIYEAVMAGAEFRGVPFNLEGEKWEDHIGDILTKGLPYALTTINEWLATLPVGYPEDEPILLEDLPVLIEAALKHPGLKLFLERSKGLVGSLTQMMGSMTTNSSTAQTD